MTPKMPGNMPSGPLQAGAILKLKRSQSFECTPWISGPAPESSDIQFGELTVGITPRDLSVHAPRSISL